MDCGNSKTPRYRSRTFTQTDLTVRPVHIKDVENKWSCSWSLNNFWCLQNSNSFQWHSHTFMITYLAIIHSARYSISLIVLQDLVVSFVVYTLFMVSFYQSVYKFLPHVQQPQTSIDYCSQSTFNTGNMQVGICTILQYHYISSVPVMHLMLQILYSIH
jgi:hypothetical protein